MYYCGTTRISNPKTLQNWIDRSWYKETIDEGYVFNIGCGRFKTETCTCTQCRNRTRPLLLEVLLKNKLI